jgi:phosphatidylserine/phosphatidylglycerophosphate/cardiolipin synthase-like enzyme
MRAALLSLASLLIFPACNTAELYVGNTPHERFGPREAEPAPEEPVDPGADAAPPSAKDAAPNTKCSAFDPRSVAAQVGITPEQGETPYVNTLTKAKTKIDVMIYIMGAGGVLNTLKAKAQAGVKVRVLMDVGSRSINQKYADQLTAAGAQVAWSDPVFPYMHAKMLVVDDEEAVISTGNYLIYNIQDERNYQAIVRDPEDVQTMSALFEADWNRRSPDLQCTRLLVSPVNSKQRILDVINAAKKTLYIESMQLADWDVRNAVVARKRAGVDVRVILAAPSWVDTNTAAGQFLVQNQIAAKYLTTPEVHAKAIMTDGELAYIGSENLSSTSLTKNREVGLVLTKVEKAGIDAMVATFDKDWAAATSF